MESAQLLLATTVRSSWSSTIEWFHITRCQIAKLCDSLKTGQKQILTINSSELFTPSNAFEVKYPKEFMADRQMMPQLDQIILSLLTLITWGNIQMQDEFSRHRGALWRRFSAIYYLFP